jgi:predicted metal-dependent peptidase
MGVDRHYRVYINNSFTEYLIQLARAISPSNPCPACKATYHHDLAYVGGVICHEAQHPVRDHSDRAQEISAESFLFNLAGDLEINDDLLETFKAAFAEHSQKGLPFPQLCLPHHPELTVYTSKGKPRDVAMLTMDELTLGSKRGKVDIWATDIPGVNPIHCTLQFDGHLLHVTPIGGATISVKPGKKFRLGNQDVTYRLELPLLAEIYRRPRYAKHGIKFPDDRIAEEYYYKLLDLRDKEQEEEEEDKKEKDSEEEDTSPNKDGEPDQPDKDGEESEDGEPSEDGEGEEEGEGEDGGDEPGEGEEGTGDEESEGEGEGEGEGKGKGKRSGDQEGSGDSPGESDEEGEGDEEGGEGDGEGDEKGEGKGKSGQGQTDSDSGQKNEDLAPSDEEGDGEPRLVNDRFPRGQNCGSGAHGEEEEYEDGDPSPDNPGISDAENDAIKREVAKNIQVQQATRGDVPAGMARWAEEILAPPKIDWRKQFAKLVRRAVTRAFGHDQRSWHRLGRSSAATNYKLLYPSTYTPVPKVGVVLDTSGSMGYGNEGDALHTACSETEGICKSVGAEVSFISVDAQASEVKEVRTFAEARKAMQGGGGTDMRVGIRVMEEMREPPTVVVVLTDGYTPWPESKPTNMEVIAALCGSCIDTESVPHWMGKIVIEED